MPQKPHVRTLTDSQHVQGFTGSESLLNNARQNFCHIFDHSEGISAQKSLF